MSQQFPLPTNLPVPIDDGKCLHLIPGLVIPSVALQATNGSVVDPSKLKGTTLLYCYPMTGRPGEDLPEGWDLIPGASGCSPQSCSFRDHFKELQGLGVQQVFGLSTQDTERQKEAAERLHLPFAILSDLKLEFVKALNLPTFSVKEIERELVKRVTMLIQDGHILKVFYPIFPPDENAKVVVEWLKGQ